MRFRPAWAYIDGVRTFCRFFCETTFQRQEVAERAQLVLQETLENAVKYSTPGDASELELELCSEREDLRIAVTSRPDPAHLDNLKHELEHLKLLDPEAAYIAAFMRASQEPEASSRLGLARMRYEGQFELHLSESDNGRVCVTAVGRL